jgi:hypothetical protein
VVEQKQSPRKPYFTGFLGLFGGDEGACFYCFPLFLFFSQCLKKPYFIGFFALFAFLRFPSK